MEFQVNKISRKTVSGLAGVLLCVVCIVGCGDSVSRRIAEATKPHIRKMAVMYKAYSNAHQFQGPGSADELKVWVQGDEQARERMRRFGINVDKFDSFLVSDRTGDEFEFIWGIKKGPMAPPYPVVFEPNAVDGHREVGMAGGKTLRVTDDDLYNQLKLGDFDPDDFDEVTTGIERAGSR